MESDLPWIPFAVREALMADATFAAACHNRCSTTKAPADVTKPFALCRLVVNSVQPLGGGGYRAWVQVDGYAPDSGYGGEEGDPIAWRIADRAKRALERVRNRPYESMHFSCTPRAIGSLDPDDTRGEDQVLRRAATQVEITIHNL